MSGRVSGFIFSCLQRCLPSSEHGPRWVGAPEPRLKPLEVKKAPTLQPCSPEINMSLSPPLGCLKHCKDKGESQLNSPRLGTGRQAATTSW